MVKEKTKINFHDKIMNPFEAELYVLGLRFGLIKPKLVGDEEHDYLKLKYLEEKRGEAGDTRTNSSCSSRASRDRHR